MELTEDRHITTMHCPYCNGHAIFMANMLSDAQIQRERRKHIFCSFVYARCQGERRFLFILLLIYCACVAAGLIGELIAFFIFGTTL